MAAPAVLAFDLNETLIDLSTLDPVFEDVLGDATLRPVWFATMLQLSFVDGLTGRYTDYTTLQRAALRMTADRESLDLADDGVDRVVDGLCEVPAHPDVLPGLSRLAADGPRLVSLTNSPLEVARRQVEAAGLADHLELVLSADEVRSLKPNPAPYEMVAERCRVAIGDVALVAVHAWDVSGALAAGCRAVLIGRGHQVPSRIGPQPELIVHDVEGLADVFAGDGR